MYQNYHYFHYMTKQLPTFNVSDNLSSSMLKLNESINSDFESIHMKDIYFSIKIKLEQTIPIWLTFYKWKQENRMEIHT